jgi:serine/threonine protein kinase/Flp pilus assembly protein TadD
MIKPTQPGVAAEERLVQALDGYLAALQAGSPPSRSELLARYPEVAGDLAECLASLDFIRRAAVRPALGPPPRNGEGGAEGPGQMLGDYRLLREVGRGGMGVVYEAEQTSLGRRVALKLLPFAAALDAKQLRRFKHEAQAAAHLHHEHIVPVYFVGCERGVHYYAMQFIDGQTLAAVIRRFRRQAGEKDGAPPRHEPGSTVEDRGPGADTLPSALRSSAHHPGCCFFREVVRLGVQAAEALEYAHAQGVIHRDIKPANLLVDGQGKLWITDFGLARFQSDAGLTMTGDLLGTLRYMSPEQALGQHGLVDQRADVYSLGATLYELLTQEPVFDGRDREELLRQIAWEEPRPPRRVNPAIPVELETIVLKAIAKEPERRYATAQELEEDLRRFLDHRPILARRPTPRERVWKWAQRHRPVVSTLAVCLILGVLGLTLSTFLVWHEKEATRKALKQAERQWELAQHKEAEIEAQWARAERNFRRACDGVEQMLLEVDNKHWVGIPRIQDLREALAEKGSSIFQSFLEEDSTDLAVRFQTARAHALVASVCSAQGKGQPATAAFRKAIALLEQLVAESPANHDYVHALAKSHNTLGMVLHAMHHPEEAEGEFAAAVQLYRRALDMGPCACSLNNLAWLRVTCPVPRFLDPAEAVALAQHALDMQPNEGEIWNTLGVAQYRAGHYEQAIAGLTRSMELRKGGDGFDWCFLAMAYWQLGDKAKAREWYEKGADDLRQVGITQESVLPYAAEAAELLGMPPLRAGAPGRVNH